MKLILEESTIRLTRFFWFGFRYDRYFLELGDEDVIFLCNCPLFPKPLSELKHDWNSWTRFKNTVFANFDYQQILRTNGTPRILFCIKL
ncbi:hypothetical protein LXL04_004700 [Taraxacum kok-saghyz]